jgi:ABC-2 type transport system permease protein
VTSRRAITLVAVRELRENARSRAFRASTGVQLLAVVAIIVLGAVLGGNGTEDADVVVVGPEARAAAEIAERQAPAFDLRLRVEAAGSEEQARLRVEAGTADVALSGRRLWLAEDAPADLEPLLLAAAREARVVAALERSGLEQDQIRAALEPPPLDVRELGGDDSGGEGLAFLATLILYVAIFTFGIAVASGIVEEKSSRVVEVVLSAIRPGELLTGKVVGLGLLGLGQLVLIGGAAVLTAALVGRVDVPDTTAALLAIIVLCFLLGYAFYACAFAVAGAIVSRHQDLQSTTAPMTLALVAAYLVSIPATSDPDGTLARVATFVPPFAPIVVPARAARNALPAWELALSVLLMLAGTAVVLVVAAQIYRRTVLRLGAPLKLSQALRLAR